MKKPDTIQQMKFLEMHGGQYFYEHVPSYKAYPHSHGAVIQYMVVNGSAKWAIAKAGELQQPITPFENFEAERFYEISLKEELKIDIFHNLLHFYNTMYITNALDSVNEAFSLFGMSEINEMIKHKDEWANNLLQMVSSVMRKNKFKIIKGDALND